MWVQEGMHDTGFCPVLVGVSKGRCFIVLSLTCNLVAILGAFCSVLQTRKEAKWLLNHKPKWQLNHGEAVKLWGDGFFKNILLAAVCHAGRKTCCHPKWSIKAQVFKRVLPPVQRGWIFKSAQCTRAPTVF